jgi:hypothetical protein
MVGGRVRTKEKSSLKVVKERRKGDGCLKERMTTDKNRKRPGTKKQGKFHERERSVYKGKIRS